MHGRLGRNDIPAQQHGKRNEQERGPLRQRPAQGKAQRGKADVNARQEENQPQIGVKQADENALEQALLQVQGKAVKEQKEAGDGQQGKGHLLKIFGQGRKIAHAKLHRVGTVQRLRGGCRAGAALIEKAQPHHGQDGADGAQRHQAKAVRRRVFVAANGGHADAHGHDEGHRHGPCGHAARIKGHAQIVDVGQKGQRKDGGVKKDEQPAQRDAKQDAQHADAQKQPHAHRHRDNEHRRVDVGHIDSQHLEVWLRNRDSHAQQKAQQQHKPQLAGFHHARAH